MCVSILKALKADYNESQGLINSKELNNIGSAQQAVEGQE